MSVWTNHCSVAWYVVVAQVIVLRLCFIAVHAVGVVNELGLGVEFCAYKHGCYALLSIFVSNNSFPLGWRLAFRW